jgi:hypothetical protein
MSELSSFSSDVEDAISRVRVPAHLVDKHGIIHWLNPAARKLLGDAVGRQNTSIVAPEEALRARRIFTPNLLGPPDGSDNKGVLLDADRDLRKVRPGPMGVPTADDLRAPAEPTRR